MKKHFFVILLISSLTFSLSAGNQQPGSLLKTNIRQLEKVQSNSTQVKICALRVTFPEDDDVRTTGNGRFLETIETDTLCQTARIDPAPHNRAYFKDHLKALSNYYSHVSNDHVFIDTVNSQVFPLNDAETIEVPHTMDYYHPFLEEDLIDTRLVQFMADAISAADASVQFSDYDLVVIFHAGVGQDFAIDYDPTPYDIPSAYLNLHDLSTALGNGDPAYNGIEVDDGSHEIQFGIILPESQNHIQYENWEDVFGTDMPCEYQIGLNGTFAFMFGFYLGIPGLYDTETGETGVGKFGLMDQGSSNMNGVIPAVPTAWTRTFMEWVDPVIAGTFQEISLQHAESGSDTLIYKIPINQDEYFLVENRNNHLRPGVSLDSIQYRKYLESDEEIWPSTFKLIKDSSGVVISSETGVVLSVPKYDLGLPGAGLLIWHVNESVIRAKLDANQVNTDRTNRGVDLEEGDGSQDLGYESTSIGTTIDIGWFFDPWFAGNDGFWEFNSTYAKDSIKSVGFNDNTVPSSRSHKGAKTGIVIDQIGEAGTTMTFRIMRKDALDNFPINLAQNQYPTPGLVKTNIEDNQTGRFVVVVDSLYLIAATGEKLHSIVNNTINADASFAVYSEIGNDNHLTIISEMSDGSITIDDYFVTDNALTYNQTKTLSGASVSSNVIPYNGNVIFASAGDLLVYTIDDNSLSEETFSQNITHLAVGNTELFAATESGAVLSISQDFSSSETVTQVSGETVAVLSAVLDNDGNEALVVVSDYLTLVKADGTVISKELDNPVLDAVVSDINNDLCNELLLCDVDKLYAYNSELITEAEFPYQKPREFHNDFAAGILSTDVDGDGQMDILVSVDSVGTLALDGSGNEISGYPKVVEDISAVSGILLNTPDGAVKVAINADECSVVAHKVSDESLSELSWDRPAGPTGNGNYPYAAQVSGNSSNELIDTRRTFNWPNPVEEGSTNIRTFVYQDCNIKVDIYDLAGELVTSKSMDNLVENDYNELVWDVSNIQSGVYFAIVKAESSGKTNRKMIKIMVVK